VSVDIDRELLHAQVKDLQDALILCAGVVALAKGDYGIHELIPGRTYEQACREVQGYCRDALMANPIRCSSR
jgi:hypothetical protein